MRKLSYLYIFILALIFTIGTYYIIKKNQYTTYNKYYETKVDEIKNEINSSIQEKNQNVLSASISFSKNINIINALENNNTKALIIDNYQDEFKEITSFEKVWIQIIDKKGNSFYRNWTNEVGDSLLDTRKEVAEIIATKKIHTDISIGKYDITFKTMVPIFNSNNTFLGIFEIITHFDSIIQSLQNKDISSALLVNKIYSDKLTKNSQHSFIQNYYISKHSKNLEVLNFLKNEQNLEDFFSKDKIIIKDNNVLSFKRILDQNNNILGFLTFSINKDFISPNYDYHNILITVFTSFIIFIITILIIYIGLNKLNLKKLFDSKNKIKILSILIILYILTITLLFTFLYFEKQNKIMSYLQEKKKDIVSQYELIEYKNKVLSNLIFDSYVNNPDILNILNDVKINPKNKDIDRNLLYNMVKTKYSIFKKYGIKQLHFHLPNNESFLRVHKPDKYGDDLTNVRPTVKYVNEHLEFIETFEEGRIYNGYRYVYPLFIGNIQEKQYHIGSVEISINMSEFVKQLSKEYNNQVMVLLNKKIVDEKLFKKEKDKYIQSDLNNFYFEPSDFEPLKFSSNFNESELDYINETIFKGNVFVKNSKKNNNIYLFLPIENKITHEIVGVIVATTPDTYIKNKSINFYTIAFFIFMFFTILLMYLYKEINHKINIQNQNIELKKQKDKTQKLLDTQESLIVVTDGKNILNANSAFLEFFELESLEQYLKKYECSCCLFDKESDEEYLTGLKDGLRWDEYIVQNRHKVIKAKLSKPSGEKNIFSVRGNYYSEDKKEKVIFFTDITNIEKLQSINKDNEIKLIEQTKMAQMGEMIANIAHQWRQPLSAISSSASAITLSQQLEILSKDDLEKYILTIMKNVSYLSETIETFRNFSKEKKELNEFDLVKKIDEVLDITKSSLNHMNIETIFNHPKELILSSISSEITQVVMNLINNARDVLIEREIKEPKIFINTFFENKNVIIEVIDNAGGINDEIIHKIFDLYFTTKHKSQGTGLGLHMCKKIVQDNLKGSIKVSNTNLGAKFTLKLPIRL